MVEPEVVRIEDQDVLVPPSLEPGLPDLKDAVLAAGAIVAMARR